MGLDNILYEDDDLEECEIHSFAWYTQRDKRGLVCLESAVMCT